MIYARFYHNQLAYTIARATNAAAQSNQRLWYWAIKEIYDLCQIVS